MSNTRGADRFRFSFCDDDTPTDDNNPTFPTEEFHPQSIADALDKSGSEPVPSPVLPPCASPKGAPGASGFPFVSPSDVASLIGNSPPQLGDRGLGASIRAKSPLAVLGSEKFKELKDSEAFLSDLIAGRFNYEGVERSTDPSFVINYFSSLYENLTFHFERALNLLKEVYTANNFGDKLPLVQSELEDKLENAEWITTAKYAETFFVCCRNQYDLISSSPLDFEPANVSALLDNINDPASVTTQFSEFFDQKKVRFLELLILILEKKEAYLNLLRDALRGSVDIEKYGEEKFKNDIKTVVSLLVRSPLAYSSLKLAFGLSKSDIYLKINRANRLNILFEGA